MSAAADVDFKALMEAADIDVPKLMQVVLGQLKTIQTLTQESMKFIEVEKITEEGNVVKEWLIALDEGFSCIRTQARKDVDYAAFLLLELSKNEPYARDSGAQEVRELEENMKKIVAAAGGMKSQMNETKISVEGLMDKTHTVLPDTSIWLLTGCSGFVAGGAAVLGLECSSCCGAVGTLALGGGYVVTGGWLALAAALGAVVGWLVGGTVGFLCDKYKEIKFGEKLIELQDALKIMHDLLDANSRNIASLQEKAVDGEVWTYNLSKIIVSWKKGLSSWETAAEHLKQKSDAFAAMGESLAFAVEGGQGTWCDGNKLLAAGAAGAGAIGGFVAMNCLKKK